jgi:hypothetical protein
MNIAYLSSTAFGLASFYALTRLKLKGFYDPEKQAHTPKGLTVLATISLLAGYGAYRYVAGTGGASNVQPAVTGVADAASLSGIMPASEWPSSS